MARVAGAAATEGIASEASMTSAVLSILIDDTLSIGSTGSWLTQTDHSWRVDGDTALDGVDGFSVTRLAGAPLDIVDHHTLCVGSTRVGLTWLDRSDTGDGRWIALISWETVAHWSVSNHSAARVGTTLVTLALGTIIDTSHKWVASLASGTGADGIAIVQLTYSLHSTW